MPRILPALACLLASALPAGAREASAFVESNLLGIFYHELGHAVIDTEGVPIFGQEEDAADVFSIFMIDALFGGDAAEEMALDAVLGFEGEARMRERDLGEIAWWDVHGPDEQRIYNTACLFYGADPEAREGFAEDAGLPEERADSCAEEYDQALASWGPVIEGMAAVAGRPSLAFTGDDGSAAARILAGEIARINGELRLSHPVTVSLESCGAANAFYDPEARGIVFCSEFVAYLEEVEALLSE